MPDTSQGATLIFGLLGLLFGGGGIVGVLRMLYGMPDRVRRETVTSIKAELGPIRERIDALERMLRDLEEETRQGIARTERIGRNNDQRVMSGVSRELRDCSRKLAELGERIARLESLKG